MLPNSNEAAPAGRPFLCCLCRRFAPRPVGVPRPPSKGVGGLGVPEGRGSQHTPAEKQPDQDLYHASLIKAFFHPICVKLLFLQHNPYKNANHRTR